MTKKTPEEISAESLAESTAKRRMPDNDDPLSAGAKTKLTMMTAAAIAACVVLAVMIWYSL